MPVSFIRGDSCSGFARRAGQNVLGGLDDQIGQLAGTGAAL
jgi:hypothetical protein